MSNKKMMIWVLIGAAVVVGIMLSSGCASTKGLPSGWYIGEGTERYLQPEERRSYHLFDSEDLSILDLTPFSVVICSPHLWEANRETLKAQGKLVLAEVHELPTNGDWDGFVVRGQHGLQPPLFLTAQIRQAFPNHIILAEMFVDSVADSSVNGGWVDLNVDLNHLMALYRQRRASELGNHKPFLSIVNSYGDCDGAMKTAKYLRWVYIGHTEGESLCQR